MDDGLKIETAAGVMLRDAIRTHTATFALVIRASRHTGQDIIGAYISGLTAAMALAIVGGHASKEEIVNATLAKLRQVLDENLRYLGRNHAKH
jgi:hypothetical protein